MTRWPARSSLTSEVTTDEQSTASFDDRGRGENSEDERSSRGSGEIIVSTGYPIPIPYSYTLATNTDGVREGSTTTDRIAPPRLASPRPANLRSHKSDARKSHSICRWHLVIWIASEDLITAGWRVVGLKAAIGLAIGRQWLIAIIERCDAMRSDGRRRDARRTCRVKCHDYFSSDRRRMRFATELRASGDEGRQN
ncbi:hypothetical protein V9T40_013113 [Parthenolecanium corni]|uniref:Uncharacterized protein n=1 Tax=Parthenolecanium corni TaxID=536013 RepID=A0AAN9Y4V1_9HEMI